MHHYPHNHYSAAETLVCRIDTSDQRRIRRQHDTETCIAYTCNHFLFFYSLCLVKKIKIIVDKLAIEFEVLSKINS